MNNRDLKIPVIIVLIIAIISLGVAFAAFNSTLVINGTASVDEVTWDIVFEGLTTENVLDSPVVVGSANVVTAPTINNNSTDISTYSVTLSAPGDSITYNFKIHNKGTIAARVTNLDIQSGVNLTTDTAKRTSALNTLNNIDYKIYYTEGNAIIGNDLEKDCLAPGEEELVSLRIIFLPSDDESVLPSTDLLLDNLGVAITYQSETSCAADSGGGNSGGGNGGGNTQLGVQYYGANETWVDTLAATADNGQTPNVYFKRQNNVISLCIDYNSSERCFSIENAETDVSQFCNSFNYDFDGDYATASAYGVACTSPNYYDPDPIGQRILIYATHIPDSYEPETNPNTYYDFQLYVDDNLCEAERTYDDETETYSLSYHCNY